ncbi:uncharacterized protein L201_000690 [Kwoniella dendrophila CBS 6074]|uniref:Uncharacterized protein n=1 Tax=Kwoniella dendrophila CBS 6074 TaxID=1295534 RepID=A0AAX4JLW0_9TREE
MQPRQIPSWNSSAKREDDSSLSIDNEMGISSSPTTQLSPLIGSGLTFSKINENQSVSKPLTPPIRFATTSNAFGLSSSSSGLNINTNPNTNINSSTKATSIPPTTSTSTNTFRNASSSSTSTSRSTVGGFGSTSGTGSEPIFGVTGMRVDISPPSAGSITTRRLRRPSMLSLQQNISFSSDNSCGQTADDEATPMNENENSLSIIQDPSSSQPHSNLDNPNPITNPNSQSSLTGHPFNANTVQPTPRWAGHGGSFANSLIRRTSSAPSIPFENLKTSTPPITAVPQLPTWETDENPMTMDMAYNDDHTKNGSSSTAANKSTLQWTPSHSRSNSSDLRKGKAKMDESKEEEVDMNISSSPIKSRLSGLPFSGKPLPNALLQTLASEHRPLDHEIQSEAKLQRYLLSHPQKLPLTPKAPKGSRGRFPDQVGGDDDDDDVPNIAGRRSISWTTTRRSRNWMDRARFDDDSDTDSDDNNEDEEMLTNTYNSSNRGIPSGGNGKEEPVNSAFAAGMDMDRPTSSSSSSTYLGSGNSISLNNSNPISESSGKSTPPHLLREQQYSNNAFPPNFANSRSARLSFSSNNNGQGMVPSPGFGLPSAFGGLGMGGNGIGTPLGSPTIERSELGASPGNNISSGGINIGSPGLMLYRESQGGQATVRPGKRKAQAEDRFDPYKRPRGTSPSLLGSTPFPLSPSRTTNSIPIPQSPSHAPLISSALSSSLSNSISFSPLPSRYNGSNNSTSRSTHPYTRPMSSRSRAASPALSIGSTGGNGLSSSLGNNSSRGLTFSNNGNSSNNTNNGGGQQQQLGGLGLLSIQNSTLNEEDEGGEEMLREDSAERMEED